MTRRPVDKKRLNKEPLMQSIGTAIAQELTRPTNLPEPTKFVNSEGKVAYYFFKNNPWRLPDSNNTQKKYRFCIICGDDRFSDEAWSYVGGRKEPWDCAPPTICKKSSCWDALAFLPSFVPRKHYIIETEEDKRLISKAHKEDCFENIENITSLVRFDKVFRHGSEMPLAYLERDILQNLRQSK